MKVFAIAFLLAFLTGCASMARDGAVVRAYNNFQRGECRDVISIVDRAVRVYEYEDERQAEMLFLKAGCMERLTDIDGAIALHAYIAHTYPETQFGFRSRRILKRVRDIEAQQAAETPRDI